MVGTCVPGCSCGWLVLRIICMVGGAVAGGGGTAPPKLCWPFIRARTLWYVFKSSALIEWPTGLTADTFASHHCRWSICGWPGTCCMIATVTLRYFDIGRPGRPTCCH